MELKIEIEMAKSALNETEQIIETATNRKIKKFMAKFNKQGNAKLFEFEGILILHKI